MTPRAWLGLAFSIACATLVFTAVNSSPGAGTLADRMVDHLTGRMSELQASFPQRPDLRPGDPVYTVEEQAFALVGRVQEISDDSPTLVRLAVDPMVPRLLGAGTRAEAMTPDQDLAWVVRTLVPPEMRGRLLVELRRTWENEREETLARLRPALMALLDDLTGVLGETLPDVIEKNRPEIERVLALLRDEVYPEELKPVIDSVWVPLMQEHLGRTASEIGKEVGERIGWGDLAGVVWTTLKRKVGLGKDDEVKKELEELLRNAALPVFKEKAKQLAAGAYKATVETVARDEVRQALEKAARRIGGHPAFKDLLKRINRDWLVDNKRLRDRLNAALADREIKKIADDLWKKVEPTFEKTLQEMLTRSDGQGMNHRLVRVLRRVVLKKDERYVLLVPGNGKPAAVENLILPGRLGRDI